MAFARPTLAELRSRVQADISGRLPGADSLLRRSVEHVLAFVLAAVAHGLYGFIAWAAKQIFVNTADDAQVVRHADTYGIERKEANYASGFIAATGVDGSTVTAGAVYQRNDGVEYVVDTDTVIAAGVASVPVTASESGAAGNADAGTLVALTAPLTGVDAEATVDVAGITNGSDQESIEALAARTETRIQEPPRGGGPGDYEAWALEVAGVTRAWEYPAQLGPGTVGVTFVRDGDTSTIIPDSAEVTAVQTHLDEIAPVTADVTVWAPTAAPLNPQISVTPDTAEVRAAVEAELLDLYAREAAPGATILLSHLDEAISLAEGETDHQIVSPVADVTHTTAQMPTLGTITWV